MSDRRKMNSTGKRRKEREFAGIHINDTGRRLLKKGARLRKTIMGWDCNVLCLLRGGPRVYDGPV
jgi:hypothetical protein